MKRDGGPASAGYKVAETLLVIAISIGGALLLQQFFVKPYRIPSESMVPTLIVGQRVLAERLSPHVTDPGLGQVLVFHPPPGVKRELPEDQCGAPVRFGQGCRKAMSGQLDATFIKRVVGLPGDTIAVANGRVVRNGQLAKEPFIDNSCQDDGLGCNLPRPIKLGPGQYYMMGDSRGNSDDSRFWGPISKKQVIGRAIGSYWPLSRLGPLN